MESFGSKVPHMKSQFERLRELQQRPRLQRPSRIESPCYQPTSEVPPPPPEPLAPPPLAPLAVPPAPPVPLQVPHAPYVPPVYQAPVQLPAHQPPLTVYPLYQPVALASVSQDDLASTASSPQDGRPAQGKQLSLRECRQLPALAISQPSSVGSPQHQLKEDLELARRMRLKLPDSLLKRIQRLKQHSLLERLRDLELDEELPRQLEDVREAVLGVRAEQQAMRRVQEEELVELCKVRSLLEREEQMERQRMERHEKEERQKLEREEREHRERLERERERDRERERLERMERELRLEKERDLERQQREEREMLRLQEERLQWEERERLQRQERDEERERDKEELRRAHWALEQHKKQDAVRIQQLQFLQDARREESLQAELKQLEQEEKEVQRRRLELQMQASPPFEPMVQPQEIRQNPHEEEELTQAYFAILNRGRPVGGLSELPEVYRAAVAIVAEHGWEALHGGENAGACWTALHWAAAENRPDVCQLLLSCRADPGHEDSLGRSASYYAALRGHAEVLAVLRDAETPALRPAVQS